MVIDDVLNSYIFVFHSLDRWPNSETQKHFQTWHSHVRLLPYINEYNKPGCHILPNLPSKVNISLFCLKVLSTKIILKIQFVKITRSIKLMYMLNILQAFRVCYSKMMIDNCHDRVLDVRNFSYQMREWS